MRREVDMECKEVQRLQGADLDEELDAPNAARLAAHRSDCADCSREYAQLAALRKQVRESGTRFGAPAGLAQRVRETLAASLPIAAPVQSPARTSALSPRAHWPWAWINFGAAATAMAALIVTLGLLLAQPGASSGLDDELVASHYRALQVDHLTDVASSDQHTVKPWFTGKLDFSPPAYDFAAKGYTLVGGRLDYVGGRSVAALAYQRHRHVINVFIWPQAGSAGAGEGARSEHGFHLLGWTDEGLAFRAVSDAAPRDLAELRDLIVEESHRRL
ncbi:anti-sigma factor [Pseudoduganella eburnea]|uniref:Anti-sigma factor n=2 Tax=Massilia eburnea TaxID=1776165 RepID=A0A6L6QBJ4_9BURK|nr:anti-sigma factor [Massilia eburnea]